VGSAPPAGGALSVVIYMLLVLANRRGLLANPSMMVGGPTRASAGAIREQRFAIGNYWTWIYRDAEGNPSSWERYTVIDASQTSLTMEMATKFQDDEPFVSHHRLDVDLASALAASGGSNESARPILAAVLLGSSIASPRLVYLLRVSAAATAPASAAVAATLAETAGAPAADAAAPSSRDATRRLLRAIATQCNSLSTIDPKLCRLHVALRAPREAELSPGLFQPRPGLALRLQRAHVATVTVTSVAGPDEDGDEWSDRAGLVCGFELPPPRPHADLAGGGMGAAAAATAAEGASEPDAAPPGPDGADGCIWWTSRALVKGFRLKKNPFEG